MFGAVVVALPSYQFGEDEHCTLLYFGSVDAPAISSLYAAEMVGTMTKLWQPFTATVTAHDVFGLPDDPVEVAKLASIDLETVHHFYGAFSTSEYRFNPHITKVNELRPLGSPVRFDRIAMWYGDDRRCWRLGSGEPCAA